MKSKFKTPKARRYTTAQVVAELAKNPKARFRIPATATTTPYRVSVARGGDNAGHMIVEAYYTFSSWVISHMPQSTKWLRVMPGSKAVSVLKVGKNGAAVIDDVATDSLKDGSYVIRARKVDAR